MRRWEGAAAWQQATVMVVWTEERWRSHTPPRLERRRAAGAMSAYACTERTRQGTSGAGGCTAQGGYGERWVVCCYPPSGYCTARARNAFTGPVRAASGRLIGDPHGGYYDEGRVWHPHVKAPAQATYGLGVGATTVVGPGGSRSRWASGSAPGAVSPGQTGSTDPTKARSSSLVQ